MRIHKTWYIQTKKSDINITLSASKRNYKEWGIEKGKSGCGYKFEIHLGRCHIEYTKYPCENISGLKN